METIPIKLIECKKLSFEDEAKLENVVTIEDIGKRINQFNEHLKSLKAKGLREDIIKEISINCNLDAAEQIDKMNESQLKQFVTTWEKLRENTKG